MNVTQTWARRWALVICGIGLAATSCAESNLADEPPSESDSSIFVGSFNVVDLIVDGSKVALSGQPTLEIDDIAASLSADTGCNTHLGSYSFFEDGTVSVTLTGGTRRDCEATTQLQDDSITDALEAVSAWTSSSQNSITLSSDDDTIELQRQ